MKIRFAFYKPLTKDICGQIISLYTWIWNPSTPGYSHVEIGFLIDGKWMYYSSASRNTSGNTGTRWLEEKVILRNIDRWDVYEAYSSTSISEMIKRCDEELGKAYDFLGILGFVTIFGQLNSKIRWYCSEICYYVFFGIWKKRVSPRRLYAILKGGLVKII